MTAIPQRVQALHRLDILDTPPEDSFDRITELTARLFKVPVACVTMVDDDRYYFKSAVGAETGSVPLEPGFCGTTIERSGVRVVKDTTLNSATKNHSLVCAAPHLRFYAAVPLITSDGFAVGTLCIMDVTPRSFNEMERNTLQELGVLVMQEMEERRTTLHAASQSQAQERAQKLESLAKVTSGIGHDFNNYLMAILGNLDLLTNQLSGDPTGKRLLENTHTAAARATELANQLLTYAGERTPAKQKTSLHEVLLSVVSVLSNGLPQGVTMKLRSVDTDIQVDADPDQIRLALVNVILNAAESYGQQPGLVDISLERVADQALVHIVDRGCGIEPEVHHQIFDPFFSTKVPRRGLGLATAQRIANDHGGHLEIVSVSGSGTHCTVTLPCLIRKNALPNANNAPVQPLSLSHITVLIVDDEPDVRRYLVAATKHLGCTVLEASSGHEAIKMLGEQGEHVDLILLDTSMPTISGDATLRLIHQQIHEIPAVIMSGHDLANIKDRFDDLEVAGFLQKPFGINQLKNALQSSVSLENT